MDCTGWELVPGLPQIWKDFRGPWLGGNGTSGQCVSASFLTCATVKLPACRAHSSTKGVKPGVKPLVVLLGTQWLDRDLEPGRGSHLDPKNTGRWGPGWGSAAPWWPLCLTQLPRLGPVASRTCPPAPTPYPVGTALAACLCCCPTPRLACALKELVSCPQCPCPHCFPVPNESNVTAAGEHVLGTNCAPCASPAE